MILSSSLATSLRTTLNLTLGKLDSLLGGKKPLVTILCYHSVADDDWLFSSTVESITKQVEALSKEFAFISLSDLASYLKGNKEILKPSVVFTFDDGYANLLSLLPLTQKYNLKPTVFLIAESQNANRQELENNLPFLSVPQVKQLMRAGWEFGSHTATHPNLHLCNDQQLHHEMITSKVILEEKLSEKCRFIAYPKGKYNQKVLQIADEAGYELGLTMDDSNVSTSSDRLLLPRIGINSSHSVEEVMVLNRQLVQTTRKILKKIFI